jgi:hypothetical protein
MLQISHKIGHGCRGLLSLILCVSFNLICELFFATPVDWQSIRGMVVIDRVMYKKTLVNEDFYLIGSIFKMNIKKCQIANFDKYGSEK